MPTIPTECRRSQKCSAALKMKAVLCVPAGMSRAQSGDVLKVTLKIFGNFTLNLKILN